MHAQLQLCAATLQLLDPTLSLHLDACHSSNFFFLFRPLLVAFKREFSFDAILTLWERIWTDFLTAQFQIFVALAVLEKHRSVIIAHLRGFDEVLKYVNELAGRMDVDSTVLAAEGLFCRFEAAVREVDRRDGLPLPSDASAHVRDSRPEPLQKEVVVTPELRGLLRR